MAHPTSDGFSSSTRLGTYSPRRERLQTNIPSGDMASATTLVPGQFVPQSFGSNNSVYSTSTINNVNVNINIYMIIHYIYKYIGIGPIGYIYMYMYMAVPFGISISSPR